MSAEVVVLLNCILLAHAQADWLAKVEPFIRERMERYSAGEVRFNLMALCGDRRAGLTKQVRVEQGALASIAVGDGDWHTSTGSSC
jgi:hypothetical protein